VNASKKNKPVSNDSRLGSNISSANHSRSEPWENVGQPCFDPQPDVWSIGMLYEGLAVFGQRGMVANPLENTNLQWNSRGHFFTAAAIAMRRILIDRARKRKAVKRGQGIRPAPLGDIDPAANSVSTSSGGKIDILELDHALQILEAESPDLSKLVNLRFFAGLTVEEAAESLGISVRTANRNWSYARARLFQLINAAAG
jgi:RNA polymerase sigma factor (TIGR02999 family)